MRRVKTLNGCVAGEWESSACTTPGRIGCQRGVTNERGGTANKYQECREVLVSVERAACVAVNKGQACADRFDARRS